MADSANTLRAGIFVVGGLCLGLVGYVLLAGSMAQGDRYVLILDNLGGLEQGAGVQFEGYPIGTVDSITPQFSDSDLRFEIVLSVQDDWPIYADSVASIASENLLSPKAVQIERGSSSELIATGSEIPVRAPVDALAGVLRTAEQFEELVQSEFVPVLQTVNSLLDGEIRDSVAGMGDLLRPLSEEAPVLINRLRLVVERLESALSDEMIGQAGDAVGELASLVTETKTLVGDVNAGLNQDIRPKVVGVLDDVTSLVGDLDTGLNQEIRPQVANVLDNVTSLTDAEVQAKVTRSLDRLEGASKDMRVMSQNLSALSVASDDRILAIIDRLERAAMNLEDMTATIRSEPSRLIRGTE